MAKKRPPKHPDPLTAARDLWNSKNYFITTHATQRKGDRTVIDPEIGSIISNGYWEWRKDEFKPGYNNWNYAIRGKTRDDRELRIVITFEEEEDGELLLIITVIDLDI